jgi:Fur family ferric uptake transcriptional regulator
MDFKQKIQQCGLKATAGRIALLQQIYIAKEPLSYDDLRSSLSMDKASFYRSIAKFEERGVVNSFESSNKRRYYEYRRDVHAHFICLDCGVIECIREKIIHMPEYRIETAVLTGHCKKCLELAPKF